MAVSTRSFPRPFTIYAGNVEDVSLGAGDFARALTNAERRNQRRGDGGQRGRGTRSDSASQPWWARTERRTETGSSSKDYADAEDDAVNQRAPKSVEGKDLAPQMWLSSRSLSGERFPTAVRVATQWKWLPISRLITRKYRKSDVIRTRNPESVRRALSAKVFVFRRLDCVRTPCHLCRWLF